VLPDSATLAHRKPILDVAASRRLPAMYPFAEMTDDGGLMSYGPNLIESFRLAATYVDKVLKGARVADLPIAQATRFDLAVNLTTARALGLTIPPALLLRADRVIGP
jgi:putative ABC transport system substrate-binding protein